MGKTFCRGSVTCARCAKVGHDSSNCERTERCINCKGDYPAYLKYYPKWIFEKEIQAVKATKNIRYIEASQEVESRTPSVGISYTSIVKSSLKSVSDASTQTLPVITLDSPSEKLNYPVSTHSTIRELD